MSCCKLRYKIDDEDLQLGDVVAVPDILQEYGIVEFIYGRIVFDGVAFRIAYEYSQIEEIEKIPGDSFIVRDEKLKKKVIENKLSWIPEELLNCESNG